MERINNSLYLCALRASEQRPKLEIIQKLGRLYICNISSDKANDFGVSDKVGSGVSIHRDLAVAKSLSEYTERLAFRVGKKRKDPLCLTNSTEGFASYPRTKLFSLKIVRENSLLESIERYCWTRFWHHPSSYFIRHDETILFEFDLSNVGIESVDFIHPDISSPYKFCICTAKISETGLVLGGACAKSEKEAENKAFTEALRHLIAVKNIENGFEAEDQNYGNRLKFLSDHGCELFSERLNAKSKSKSTIMLPQLDLEGLLNHRFDKYQHVYRTRFSGQIEFINSRADVGYI